MAKKETNIWGELKGVKDKLVENLEIKLGDVEVTIPVKFVDYDEIQEINKEYEEKLPEKPMIKQKIGGDTYNIKVPSEEEKFKAFNDHPKAKEWQEKVAPIERERKIRLAYEFISDDYKPGDNIDEGIKILDDDLREIDRLAIIEKGFELNGISNRLSEAEKN